jgi:hypothetical protein
MTIDHLELFVVPPLKAVIVNELRRVRNPLPIVEL